jgi:hypothetical protein
MADFLKGSLTSWETKTYLERWAMNKRVNELTPERAKVLLGENEISEERLKKVLDRIKVFCKVAYQLYSKRNQVTTESTDARQLNSEPPDQFTKAA